MQYQAKLAEDLRAAQAAKAAQAQPADFEDMLIAAAQAAQAAQAKGASAQKAQAKGQAQAVGDKLPAARVKSLYNIAYKKLTGTKAKKTLYSGFAKRMRAGEPSEKDEAVWQLMRSAEPGVSNYF